MLQHIQSPADVRNLSEEALMSLAKEMREEILRVVSKNGGHLGSNLGMVETTIALHRVFSSPNDKVIFDVGHQCYPHKLLTGRYNRFETLRTYGGLSGFPDRKESEHDIMNEGHCGTSISQALGIAEANKRLGNGNYTVAVVGDGAMTCGMIYEALNNCAGRALDLIILINDNEMSISGNVGGLHAYLSRIRTSKRYFRLKRKTEGVLTKIPLIGWGIAVGLKHLKDFIRRLFVRDNLFEDLGLLYLGPVDGHDIRKLSIVLEEAKKKHMPCIVHMNTIKGKGYERAEKDPGRYHGVSPFEIDRGVTSSGEETFTSFVGRMLTEKAMTDDKLCTITAAMRDGTGLSDFAKIFPDRFYDVGIAEEHAVTFAAGLVRGGMRPVPILYSTFMQRSYDQLLHDVAIQKLPMLLLLDRAGLVPGDGVTHQGVFDIPLLTAIPDINIYSPEKISELGSIFASAYDRKDFTVIRYPKGGEEQYEPALSMISYGDFEASENIAKAKTVIVTFGRMTKVAHEAVRLLKDDTVGIFKLIRIFPLDIDTIVEMLEHAEVIYFLEESYRYGGISEKLASIFGNKKTIIHAVEALIPHGTLPELYEACGFTAERVAERLRALRI